MKNAKSSHDVEKIISDATKVKKQKRLAASADVTEPQIDSSVDEGDENKEPTAEVPVRGIEESGLHIVLKKIIKNDKERLSQNDGAETFGSILVQKLNDDTVSKTRFAYIIYNNLTYLFSASRLGECKPGLFHIIKYF